jgi:hypothetical protein
MPGSVRATVALEPGLAGPIESALGELIAYPYGCVEQTMSRFMPAVVAGRALKAAKLHNAREKELPDIFAKGLARLAGFQHKDGGWGWWETDQSNDFMTAYVLEGLALCKAGGHPVPAGMLDRATDYLAARFINNRLSGGLVGAIGEVDIRIYAAHALATRYALDAETHRTEAERTASILTGITTGPEQIPLSDRDAVLRADALRLLGDDAAAKRLLPDLADRAGRFGRDRASIFAGASLLELGAALEPKDSRWQLLARHLVLARNGAAWTDTLTSATAVRGLAALLAAAPGECGPVEVLVGNRAVAVLKPDKNQRVAVQLGREIEGARAIRVRPLTAGSAGFWSARVEGYLADPPAPPTDPAARVVCRYFRVVPQREEIRPDKQGRLPVTVGQTVEVRLECELNQALSLLRLSFPRPCGVELAYRAEIGKDGLVAMEERDDGIHFFADHWDKGPHVVRFMVRAETEGEVFAPPPELAPMYGDPVPVAVQAPTAWQIQR